MTNVNADTNKPFTTKFSDCICSGAGRSTLPAGLPEHLFGRPKIVCDKKQITIIAALTGLMVFTLGTADWKFTEIQNELCKAAIMQEKTGQMVVFQGIVVTKTDKLMTGNYTLEAIREGVSGRSNSRQDGEFSLAGGNESGLSKKHPLI